MPVLGYDYIGARADTTQQSGQTPDKEVEIKNITVYFSGYTESDTTGMLSPPTVWSFGVAANMNSNFLFLFQLDTLLFSFFTLTIFLYMFRTGWSIIRRIKCLFTRAASGTVPSVVGVSCVAVGVRTCREKL